MKKAATILCALGVASAASADDLLTVDLSNANEITISATSGNSAATISGSDTTGYYLADIFATAGLAVTDTLVSGDLTSASNPSDGTPDLFTSTFTPGNGLNVFSSSTDLDLDFFVGTQAFSGSATWTLDAASYSDLVAGSPVGSTGDIYFPADTEDDLAGATILGTWRVVPAPSSMALLGLGGLVAGRRRR